MRRDIYRVRRPRYPADIATAPRPVAGLAVNVSVAAGGRAIAARLAGGPARERSSAEPGLTLAASGLTPARRISPRTSAAWAGSAR